MKPWFCGCLSLMIPGAGQFYTRRISKGLLFLFFSIGAGVAEDYMLGTTRFLGLLPAVGFFIFGILVTIVAIWDAVHFVKRQQAIPKGTPDPWFGVFLSLIIGPLVYVYLRKWLYCILCLIIAVLSAFLIRNKLLAYIVLFIFFVGVPIHVYLIAEKKHGQMRGNAAILFFVLLIFSKSLAIADEYLEDRYGIWAGGAVSGSMEPTLKINERVFVNNFAYIVGDPEVNDIVVIKTSEVARDPNALFSADETKKPTLTKRIVATGGDVIEVNDGIVRVNGKVRKYYPDITTDSNAGTTHSKDWFLLAQNGPYRVPEGKFFVMGDNINNSFDSRCFGAVPRDAIIGKVVKVYWPPSKARVLK